MDIACKLQSRSIGDPQRHGGGGKAAECPGTSSQWVSGPKPWKGMPPKAAKHYTTLRNRICSFMCACANLGTHEIFHGLGSHSDCRVLFDANFFLFFPGPTGCQKRYPKRYPNHSLIETIQLRKLSPKRLSLSLCMCRDVHSKPSA